MARHRARRSRFVWVSPVLLIAAAGAAVYYAGGLNVLRDEPFPEATQDGALDIDWCTQLRIVTSSSYRPVLTEIEPLLASSDVCVQLDVEVANGLDALSRVAESGAHVWIPDDAAWAGAADQFEIDEDGPGAGTVVATSPIYMVADEATAQQIDDAGGSWLGLATLLSDEAPGPTLVLQDPARSGDGLVAAGAVGEAVWLDAGMDASAQAMTAALPSTRIVEDDALPSESGEVGLLPEYVLVGLLASGDAATIGASELITGADNTAIMRYTWLPTGVDGDDPAVTAAMQRVVDTLAGEESADARGRAGLRSAHLAPVTVDADTFPALQGEPFEVFSPHAVDHVFATYYEHNRRADFHLVIDISGSMAETPPGSDLPVLDLVKLGLQDMTGLLPDDAQVGLWQFGTQLAPPNDWVELVPIGPLEPGQREALDGALAEMIALDTGTGLYNTMLDAYLHAQENYREGVPSHAVVFTDGRNEFRPGSLTVEDITAELEAAHDPQRPVQLTVVAMGSEPDAEVLEGVLEPVENYLAPITAADEIRAVLIHLAAGGVHH